MGRIFYLFLLLCLLLSGGVTFAEEPAIHSVEIHTDLLENGDAEIWELWDVTVTSGTEWYLSLNGMKDMPVSGLSVSDETGAQYKNVGKWDVDRSLSEKANTCGIVEKKSDGYELCWGVGSYGRHQFFVSYTISGLVKQYEDGVGFNHTFLSRDLSSPVDTASVTLYRPGHALDESNAACWAFGFEGAIEFVDGNILAQSQKRITKKQGIILMVELDQALFPTAPQGTGTFEAIKNRALEGSDYAGNDASGNSLVPGSMWGIIGAVVALGAFGITWGVLRASLPDVYYRKKYGLSRADMKKNAEPINQTPFLGDLPKTVALLTFLKDSPSQVSIFNFYLLKWMREGVITETETYQNDQRKVSIRLGNLAYGADALEAQLHGMLVAAANQGELTEKDIKKWASKKASQIDQWHKDYVKQAEERLLSEDITTDEPVRRAFVSATVKVLNEKGWAYAQQLYGFKNHLRQCAQEGTLPEDGDRRDEMLAYADILGLYDEMEAQYKSDYAGGYAYGHYYYMSRSFRTAYKSGVASRSSGGGGSSSVGGGGGASGGGGGGSR